MQAPSHRRSAVLSAALLAVAGLCASWADAAPSSDPSGRLAVQYAEAMAAGRIQQWAELDLGCLARRREAKDATAEACWKETLATHARELADQPETGIFNAQGRGAGFGLLHESHRKADLWRDYPPAVFVSPSVWQRGGAPPPRVALVKTLPPRVTGLQQSGDRPPVRVSVTLVELSVTYPDPLTAPMALRPGELWWASGQIRKYGPVHDLIVRVPVLSGLKAAGYANDRAVLSAGLPEAPMLLGTASGGIGDLGRATEAGGKELAGGLLLGSARWWDRTSAGTIFDAELKAIRQLPPSPERLARLFRLMRLDDRDRDLHRLMGDDLYANLLQAGLTLGGITAGDDGTRRALAELYWTIQAPTWRQELTEVAVGHSEVAEALYRAAGAYDIVAQGGRADAELMRRIGTLQRWNNDSEAAIEIHGKLLRALDAKAARARGVLLAEIAWDRLQWLFWTRKYDHPWLAQAKQEAEQALALAETPMGKLIAQEAILVAEALTIPRQTDRVQASVESLRQQHAQLANVGGLWNHLVGNDMVKALVAEGKSVGPPKIIKSPEVLDVRVHATPPPQDLLRTWEFDEDQPGSVPKGFSAVASDGVSSWSVTADANAPTAPHVLTHAGGCRAADCFELLLAEATGFAYPDVTVHVRADAGSAGAGAGLVMTAPDQRLSYVVTLDQASSTVAIHRIMDGRIELLDTKPVQLITRPWHVVRVQRINFAHVSRPRLSIFVDGREISAVTDDAIPKLDRIGLATRGAVTAAFDRLHALDLVTNQPLSAPAAY
jgi:hypothetical protein